MHGENLKLMCVKRYVSVRLHISPAASICMKQQFNINFIIHDDAHLEYIKFSEEKSHILITQMKCDTHVTGCTLNS